MFREHIFRQGAFLSISTHVEIFLISCFCFRITVCFLHVCREVVLIDGKDGAHVAIAGAIAREFSVL